MLTTTFKRFDLKSIGLSALAAVALTVTLPAASAMAADASTASAAPVTSTAVFQVKSAADGKIRAGVSAFEKGDYQKALTFNRSALSGGGLSPRKAAIVQSNLCAAYAMIGEMDKASSACATALELRPNYAPAKANKAALTVKLAQLDPAPIN